MTNDLFFKAIGAAKKIDATFKHKPWYLGVKIKDKKDPCVEVNVNREDISFAVIDGVKIIVKNTNEVKK